MLKVRFNQTVFDSASGGSQFNKESLSILLKKAYTDNLLPLSWAVLNANGSLLSIKLTFEDSSTISTLA